MHLNQSFKQTEQFSFSELDKFYLFNLFKRAEGWIHWYSPSELYNNLVMKLLTKTWARVCKKVSNVASFGKKN